MIHRLLACGPAALVALLAASFVAAPALACRTTTCAAPDAPDTCMRDPVTLCWLNGEPLTWEQGCVSFSVHEAGVPSLGLDYAATESLVAQAFALWPNTVCADGAFPSIAVTHMGPLACDQVDHHKTGPNANAVLFRETEWHHDPTAIGLTTVTFNTTTGEIADADVEVNLTGFQLSADSLAYVVAHEAGHFFGLDHSADGSALMFLNYSPIGGAGPPMLVPDDVNSICAAYPISRPVPVCDFEPERGFSSECGGDVEAGCAIKSSSRSAPRWVAAAVLLALLGRARSRSGRDRHRRSTMRP